MVPWTQPVTNRGAAIVAMYESLALKVASPAGVNKILIDFTSKGLDSG